jgi:DNA-binding MarR family transcriptional regulator
VDDDEQQNDTAELAARLRMAIARMARFLRQQDQGELTATFKSALATIDKCGPMTLGEVAARERIAPPSVTKAVEKLVTLGLVSRRVDPTDRRVSLVSITEDGQRHLAANRARRDEWLAGRMEHLDPSEVQRLVDALGALEHLVDLAASEPVQPVEPEVERAVSMPAGGR